MTSPQPGMNLGDSVYERLLRERIIFLGQQVDDEIANKLCAQILLLSAEDPTRDINLYINSPGGSISAGTATSMSRLSELFSDEPCGGVGCQHAVDEGCAREDEFSRR